MLRATRDFAESMAFASVMMAAIVVAPVLYTGTAVICLMGVSAEALRKKLAR